MGRGRLGGGEVREVEGRWNVRVLQAQGGAGFSSEQDGSPRSFGQAEE